MSYLTDICCICLEKNRVLVSYTQRNDSELSYYEKVFLLIPQMCFSKITSDSKVCRDCSTCIDSTMRFREMCLKNKEVLLDFAEEFKNEDDKNSDDLAEFKKSRMKVDDTINEPENEDNNNAADDTKTETVSEEVTNGIDSELNSSDLITLKKINDMLRRKKRRRLQARYELKRRRIKRRKIQPQNEPTATNDITTDNSIENDTISSVIESVIRASCKQSDRPTHHENTVKNIRKRKFECQFCFQIFKHRPKFVEHYNTVHDGRKPYVCELCSKDFVENYQLTIHRRNVHSLM